MAYIGQSPSIGNFQVCDAISVVNGQAAYTMQVSSVNVVPETANHMIVSLNGIIQKPGSSYTVSGSTITFASNLATGDVIDFIHILGSVLDLGVPSDDTVSTAKISANAVTAAKFNADVISGQTALATAPADTDEFLVSDAGVLKRIDYSLIKGGGMFEFISETTISSDTTNIDFTTLSTDYKDFYFAIQNLHPANDEPRLYMRVFTGTGGSQAVVTSSSYGYAEIMRNETTVTDNNNSSDHMRVSHQVGNANEESISSEVFLYNPHSTTFHKLVKAHTVLMNLSGLVTIDNWGSKYAATTAVTGVRFFFQTGDIGSGKIAMYGRKRS
jgi:hypothetical protein